MSNSTIIEQIRQHRPKKAFSALYRYYPAVLKMVKLSGGKPEDAEDLYQEALIVFYQKAKEPGFTLTSSAGTYVYSICRYMWKEQLRKQQKQMFVELKQEYVAEAEFNAAMEAESRFCLAEKVIAELGERCKELLIRFYFHSKKMKDIAVKMGYNSENTAKNQKYKCLEAAKNKLKALQQN